VSLIPLCPGLATGRETHLRVDRECHGELRPPVDAEIRDSDMRFSPFVRPVFGAAFLIASAPAAVAAPTDYRFELAQAEPAGPGKTDLTVRLVHIPDKKPVPGAVLFETKADMTPEGMADMTGKVTPLASDQPGLYHFQVETGMAGKWQLSLGAKVQGEAGTVRGTVPFAAAK